MRSRFLPDELMYYQWSVARWRTSVTRESLDATGRGIFRELLDSCYTQGSIPRDPKLLCRIAGCTEKEFEAAWKVIGKHFVAHRSDPNSLVGKHAEVYRKQYFSRLKDKRAAGSRGGRPSASKSVAEKSNEISEMKTTRFPDTKPSGFTSENLKVKESKGKESKGKEKEERTPQPPEGGCASDPPEAIGDCIEATAAALRSRHPKPSGLGGLLLEQKLAEIASKAVDPCATLNSIDRRHQEAFAREWRGLEVRYVPRLLQWLDEERYLDPLPAESPPPDRLELARRALE